MYLIPFVCLFVCLFVVITITQTVMSKFCGIFGQVSLEKLNNQILGVHPDMKSNIKL